MKRTERNHGAAFKANVALDHQLRSRPVLRNEVFRGGVNQSRLASFFSVWYLHGHEPTSLSRFPVS